MPHLAQFLVPVAWLIAIGTVAYVAKWRLMLVLNAVPALLATLLVIEGGRLANNENADQSAVGVLMFGGLMMFAVGASMSASLLGAVWGILVRRRELSRLRVAG